MEQSKQTYKKQGNISLFDSEDTMDKLNSLGNPLEKLSRVVDFEMFREDLETGLYKEKFTNVGAKPYDYVLMFKILVLQRMYHLSDEQFRGGAPPAQQKTRARVEHVFGIMEGCLHGMRSRAVGFLRNEAYIIFSGLVYNLIRYEQIKRLGMN